MLPAQELADNGWGALLFDQNGHSSGKLAFGEIPPEVVQVFPQARSFIYFLETIGHRLPFIIVRGVLKNDVNEFCDNGPAKMAMAKGFSTVEAVNKLIAFHWAWDATNTISLWTERDSSEATWADAISRFQVDKATERGWREIKVDFDIVFRILMRIAIDNLGSR